MNMYNPTVKLTYNKLIHCFKGHPLDCHDGHVIVSWNLSIKVTIGNVTSHLCIKATLVAGQMTRMARWHYYWHCKFVAPAIAKLPFKRIVAVFVPNNWFAPQCEEIEVLLCTPGSQVNPWKFGIPSESSWGMGLILICGICNVSRTVLLGNISIISGGLRYSWPLA